MPGLENTKELSRWVYNASKGDISNVFEFKNKYIVAKLVGIRNKGTLPLDEVKEEIIAKVIRDKKAEQFIQEFKAQNSNDITTIAANVKVTTQKQDNLTFTAFNVFGIGREDALIGTSYALPLNKVSAPTKGENGVFVVVKTSEKIEKGPMSDIKDIQKQNSQLMTTRSEYEVYNALKEKANIEDHKGKFDF